jgi:hypothetical protein
MDQQVKQEQALGNAVIDTKSYLPLIAVKNGNVVTMFTDGFVDLSVVDKLRFPESRYPFKVALFSKMNYRNLEAQPTTTYILDAGRTELELNETSVCYIEATIITKENQ